jgi:hypothetical protein
VILLRILAQLKAIKAHDTPRVPDRIRSETRPRLRPRKASTAAEAGRIMKPTRGRNE